ncbi:MAG: family 10 glycosylhydrolase [Ktedonobacteraceae bacterium]
MSVLKSIFKQIQLFIQASILAGMVAMMVMLPSASTVRAAGYTTNMVNAVNNANCTITPEETQFPKRQFRAVWIASVANIDWPTQTGLLVAAQEQQFITILDKVQQMHMNAVMVQIRPTADALYPSKLFPWSQWLTGVQGQDPGYNPLAFMLRETHKRNLQFHAWFNPYRISLGTDLSKLAPNNPAIVHPDWVISYGGKLYFNPGIPAVRDYVTAGIMEVVNTYDIDGVHFDDYFYPYPVAGQTFPDQATYHQYGAGFSNIGDWRRDNVNKLIQGLSIAIKTAKPAVQFGVSPFGVWRNQSTDPTGSATHAGAQDYDDLYADTRAWIKNNWIDYIVPQIYWNIGFQPAAYDVLVAWWSHEVDGTNVQLYTGMAVYKIGLPGAWSDPNQMPAQLALNLKYSEVKGAVFFSMKELLANPLGFTDNLSNNIYKYPALVPVTSSAHSKAPHRVSLLPVYQTSQGAVLNWLDFNRNGFERDNPNQAGVTSYAVYRFNGKGQHSICDFNDAQYLLTTVRHTSGDAGVLQTFVDSTAQAGQTYTYYVTALNSFNQESQPSDGRALTVD